MTATPTTDIGSLITQTPGVYGGRPCLAKTRYPVIECAIHYNAGTTPEQLADEYGLPLDKVYAGYAFYLANRDAFDRQLAEDRVEYEAAKAATDPRPPQLLTGAPPDLHGPRLEQYGTPAGASECRDGRAYDGGGG